MTTKITEDNIDSLDNLAVNWQGVKTSSFTAVAGEGYFVDTTSSAITVTLPASPSIGDSIIIQDYAANFATNNVTIARNGSNIQGNTHDSTISTDRAAVMLTYVDSTKGWLYTNETNASDYGPVFYSATGGTVATSGDYKTHIFTGDGTFTVSTAASGPSTYTNVDYLVVAGGGGTGCAGADDRVGGAGAGGFRTSNGVGLCCASPLAASCGLTLTATSYPIVVGGGGATETSGSASSFSTITSAGGGHVTGNCTSGNTGGSGSGGSSGGPNSYPSGGFSGGAGNTPSVSPPQGNPGGIGVHLYPVWARGGGGGGAGAPGGGTLAQCSCSAGGIGSWVPAPFIGPTAPSYGETGPQGRFFAGGGGGTQVNVPGPGNPYVTSGGLGGGGDSAPKTQGGQSGVANTGGGGGANIALGGKGIVMIRYKFQ